MEQIDLKSVKDIHDIIVQYSPESWIFRGVSDVIDHKLLPKIGRSRHYSLDNEKTILQLFKLASVPYIPFELKTEWDWLALGQHHGLPTRLLDWSRNALVAAFFAVESLPNRDGGVYFCPNLPSVDQDKLVDPLDVTEMMQVHPRHTSLRIPAQAAAFTIHPEPNREFVNSELKCLIIPAHLKTKTREFLYYCGIHRGSLFPDLDGQSSLIQWLRLGS